MRPSSYVCRRLHEVAPDLRLAWHGPGKRFAFVYLFSRKAFGSLTRPKGFLEPWNLTLIIDPSTGDPGFKPIDRGPMFTKKGEIGVDWNQDEIIPIFHSHIRNYGLTNADIMSEERFNTFVVPKILEMYTSAKDRIAKDRERRIKEAEEQIDERARAGAEYIKKAKQAGEIHDNHTITIDERVAAVQKVQDKLARQAHKEAID